MDKYITLSRGDEEPVIMRKDHGVYAPVTDSRWRSEIHHYDELTDKGKARQRRRKMKSGKNRCKAHIKSRLPNAGKRLRTQTGKSPPNANDYRLGLLALLSLVDLFPSPAIGLTLIATILCGLAAYDLRSVEPTFAPMMAVNSSDQMLRWLSNLIYSIVPREKWNGKYCEVKRTAILDFTKNSGNIINFSRVRVKLKKIKSVWLPFPYTDTAALVANATDSGWKSVAEYLRNAGTIFFNCKLTGELGPTKLPRYSITAYDQGTADKILEHGPQIAALLRLWWDSKPLEDWANRTVRAAKDSMGKIDERFISVQYDPQKLRAAVYLQVLETLFARSRERDFISEEELAPYRKAARNTFNPPPLESVQPKRAEDAEVFCSIMTRLAAENPDCIAGFDDRCRPRQKPFSAAWRDISGIRHLIVEEASWKTAYAKAARDDKQIDRSVLQLNEWDLEVLKNLADTGVIKKPSSGYRYRYDLFRTGSKVNVLAIKADRLDV